MDLPKDLLYSKSHEWVRFEGEVAVIGVTDFAQNELGDVVFVELPTPGRILAIDEIFGSIESVKAVSDLIAPVKGEVVEMNDGLEADPSLVNSSPYADAWMIKVRVDDPAARDGLIDEAAYRKHCHGS